MASSIGSAMEWNAFPSAKRARNEAPSARVGTASQSVEREEGARGYSAGEKRAREDASEGLILLSRGMRSDRRFSSLVNTALADKREVVIPERRRKNSENVWNDMEVTFIVEHLSLSNRELCRAFEEAFPQRRTPDAIKKKKYTLITQSTRGTPTRTTEMSRLWRMHVWTEAEDQFVKDNACKMSRGEFRSRLNERFGTERTWQNITNRIAFLGLVTGRTVSKGLWTQREVEYIKANRNRSLSKLQEGLFGLTSVQRTHAAISSQIRKLKSSDSSSSGEE